MWKECVLSVARGQGGSWEENGGKGKPLRDWWVVYVVSSGGKSAASGGPKFEPKELNESSSEELSFWGVELQGYTRVYETWSFLLHKTASGISYDAKI